MGSWNKTCGLSNLHITAGSDVYVFILENKHPAADDRCYSTALYSPVLLPFYSKYNDYGAGEESSGIALPLIMDALREALVEKELGENEYHDIAITRKDFNEEMFWMSVHEGRLDVKRYGYSEENSVEYVMFRKDIVDDILENWQRDKYVGPGKGNAPAPYANDDNDRSYIYYKFADVVADIPALIAKLHEAIKDEMEDAESRSIPLSASAVLALFNFQKMGRSVGSVFEWNSPNKASWYCSTDDRYRYSQIVRIDEVILHLVAAGDIDGATKILTEHIKARYIDSFMNCIRKVWIPGCHEGSQSQEPEGYRALIAATTRALDREAERWEE